MKRRNKLILEFTEFNLQRFNSDSVQASTHVDDPQLSTNAFDKHEDGLRQAMSMVNDIMFNIKGNSAFSRLRGHLALEDQDIKNLKIQRIVKTDNLSYDVYLELVIDDETYWGKISNIIGLNPEFSSELFKDYDLYQPKEWVIKTKGLVIKTVKNWLKPEPGMYRLLNNEVTCYSVETGKQLIMKMGIEIELIRSYDNKLVVRYDSDTYNLIGDNHIYFNWWFEKID